MELNCWEAKQCGCQPGGKKSKERGICPAALETKADGINGGFNGGRSCWAIKNTLCNGLKGQSTFGQKMYICMQCDFYRTVRYEEKERFVLTREILKKLWPNTDSSRRIPASRKEGNLTVHAVHY